MSGEANAGWRSPRAKFTEKQVAAIKRRHRAGEKGRDLANELGVHEGTISRIVNRIYYTTKVRPR